MQSFLKHWNVYRIFSFLNVLNWMLLVCVFVCVCVYVHTAPMFVYCVTAQSLKLFDNAQAATIFYLHMVILFSVISQPFHSFHLLMSLFGCFEWVRVSQRFFVGDQCSYMYISTVTNFILAHKKKTFKNHSTKGSLDNNLVKVILFFLFIYLFIYFCPCNYHFTNTH